MQLRSGVVGVLLTAMIGNLLAQDGVDAKKKKVGELLKDQASLMKKAEETFAGSESLGASELWEQQEREALKLLGELSVGDREKEKTIRAEIEKKYAPDVQAYFDQYELR